MGHNKYQDIFDKAALKVGAHYVLDTGAIENLNTEIEKLKALMRKLIREEDEGADKTPTIDAMREAVK